MLGLTVKSTVSHPAKYVHEFSAVYASEGPENSMSVPVASITLNSRLACAEEALGEMHVRVSPSEDAFACTSTPANAHWYLER